MIWFYVYLIGFLLTIYPFSKTVLGANFGREPDSEDWFFSGIIGTIGALLWPAILIGYTLFRLSRYVWSKVKVEEADSESGTRSRSGEEDR